MQTTTNLFPCIEKNESEINNRSEMHKYPEAILSSFSFVHGFYDAFFQLDVFYSL